MEKCAKNSAKVIWGKSDNRAAEEWRHIRERAALRAHVEELGAGVYVH